MHSKARYKISSCSVIPGNLNLLENFKGLSTIVPKILDTILPITKVK